MERTGECVSAKAKKAGQTVNSKEEKPMLRDGTRDLDDLIFPEEWEISKR